MGQNSSADWVGLLIKFKDLSVQTKDIRCEFERVCDGIFFIDVETL